MLIGSGLSGNGFEYRQGQQIFLALRTLRPAVKPTQPPTQ